MDNNDWFRSSVWNDQAKQAFRTKLARARDQKCHYLRAKAAAIADNHPFDALALYDEYIHADDENIPSGNYSKSMVYLKLGDIDKALELLDRAMGESGWDMHSPAMLEFAFLVGLHKQTQHYQRALEVLKALDDLAQNSTGSNFDRNFAGSAGAAFILYELGQSEDAKHQAEASLRLALNDTEPVPKHPDLGRVPQLPKDLMNRLIMIADIWDESELGPRPPI